MPHFKQNHRPFDEHDTKIVRTLNSRIVDDKFSQNRSTVTSHTFLILFSLFHHFSLEQSPLKLCFSTGGPRPSGGPWTTFNGPPI